eukprot:6175912-Pleurochrysis_carterae.AAC.3
MVALFIAVRADRPFGDYLRSSVCDALRARLRARVSSSWRGLHYGRQEKRVMREARVGDRTHRENGRGIYGCNKLTNASREG